MENEELYHYDFTTVSDLEIFIARVEEVIQEWQLPQKSSQISQEKCSTQSKTWSKISENITFLDFTFTLTRYLRCHEDNYESTDDIKDTEHSTEDKCFSQALDQMMSMENDFSSDLTEDEHCLARWYGLQDYVVLYNSLTSSESHIKLLLSAICIATSNTNCQVPFFVQSNQSHPYFLGVCQSKGYHTDFEMIHLNRIPQPFHYLTGLLNMFRSKIEWEPINPVIISARFTYNLKDWPLNVWTQYPPDFNSLNGETIGVSEISNLPFGVLFDPIKELNLYAIWPYVIENTVFDGRSYTDMEPMKAPVWTVSVTSTSNISSLLADYFTEYLSAGTVTNTTNEILGNVVNSQSAQHDLSSSLSALTESKISAFSKAVIGGGSEKYGKQPKQVEGPISSDILMLLLYYLFPDADSECKSPYPEQYSSKVTASPDKDKPGPQKNSKFSGMKSAPYDSLPWRLAILMAHVIHSLGGVESATHLWYEFTQELRFRCERNILIPGLEPTCPDPRACLLYQKLQLLNCCIAKKIERDERAKRTEDDTDSDEEFYDCPSEVLQEDVREVKVADKPMGRLARHEEMRLLETGEFMYIPKTQEVVPKTEDQLEEDAEILVQLGTDARGSQLRARLMSASLLSDMESFKAANPGCILADFIRWYSPRDWIPDEGVDENGQQKGHLSHRMEIPGNTWLEMWEIANPVPAKWQIRLFNDTRESEKVLDFFDRQNPKGFIELLLPVMSVCAIQRIMEEADGKDCPGMEDVISSLIANAERLQKSANVSADRYQAFVNLINIAETNLVESNLLHEKFLLPGEKGEITDKEREEVTNFVHCLMTGKEVKVPGGPHSRLGSAIRYYFASDGKKSSIPTGDQLRAPSSFPLPSEKEIILRAKTPKGPQRLHAILARNECRICGAFTKDDTFF